MGRTIIFFSSVYILYVIVFVRKRTEFIYLATPISFLISGLIGMTVVFNALIKTIKGDDENLVSDLAFPLAIHYMFYTTGHQFFASQYL